MKLSKLLKIIVSVAIALIVLGGSITLSAFAAAGWDITFMSAVTYTEKTYTERTENVINRIDIDYSNAEIQIVTGETDSLCVEYPQPMNRKGEKASEITLTDENGTLTVREDVSWKQNFLLFNWNYLPPKLTVRIPAERTLQLTVATNNGSITLHGENAQFSTVSLTTNNGSLQIDKVTAQHLTAKTNNGSIGVANVSVENKTCLKTNNGSILFNGSFNANECEAETNVGSVETRNGYIAAQTVRLSTNVGSLTITLQGTRQDYTATIEHNVGKANILSGGSGAKTLHLHTDVGEINVSFTA